MTTTPGGFKAQGVRDNDGPFFTYTFMDGKGNTLFSVAVRTPGELAPLALERECAGMAD